MIKSQTQNRKSKIKWLLICLLAVVIVLLLLFYRPAYYKPQLFTEDRQLSPYLTHQLIPQFYNGVQLQEPFDLVITQQGINEIAHYLPLPEVSRRVNLTSPTVYFASNKIVIAAAANVHGARLIITLEVALSFDANGLLSVNMDKVKIGAMNVTIPARIIGRQIYGERFNNGIIDPNDIRTLLSASFFDGQPFDPVFDIDGKKVRLTGISTTPGQLNLRFTPLSNTSTPTMLRY
jgi:hypothetical protein